MIKDYQKVARLVAATVLVLSAHNCLYGQSNLTGQQKRSQDLGTSKVTVEIQNATSSDVQIFWVDQQGNEHPSGVLPKKSSGTVTTLHGHVHTFKIGNRVVGEYAATAELSQSYVLTDSASGGSKSQQAKTLEPPAGLRWKAFNDPAQVMAGATTIFSRFNPREPQSSSTKHGFLARAEIDGQWYPAFVHEETKTAIYFREGKRHPVTSEKVECLEMDAGTSRYDQPFDWYSYKGENFPEKAQPLYQMNYQGKLVDVHVVLATVENWTGPERVEDGQTGSDLRTTEAVGVTWEGRRDFSFARHADERQARLGRVYSVEKPVANVGFALVLVWELTSCLALDLQQLWQPKSCLHTATFDIFDPPARNRASRIP